MSTPSSALSEHPLVPFVVPTTKEHLEAQSHEEWFCPYCLQEDTNIHSHSYVHSCFLFHAPCCKVLFFYVCVVLCRGVLQQSRYATLLSVTAMSHTNEE
jgi:hypothetical protein